MDQPYPKTFLDAIMESIQFIERCRDNDSFTKRDVLESMENRLSFMLRKMVACPTSTSFSVFRSER
jgi:hypothetical protein